METRRLRRRALATLAIGLALPRLVRAQPALTVFAAASLADALRELSAAWQGRGNAAPRISLAASSTLARQIEQGAPADLFLSADEPWMDYLQQRGLILPASRRARLGNVLVLVTPEAAAAPPVTLAPGMALVALLGPRDRLAVADPAHVPAGRYAEAALRWRGQWEVLAPRLARAENVRAALLLVERGEAPLGIVYATDAAASRGVRLLARFPPESHPPVRYPFALTRRAEDNAAARALLDFLAGPEAAPVWRRHGFGLLG